MQATNTKIYGHSSYTILGIFLENSQKFMNLKLEILLYPLNGGV